MVSALYSVEWDRMRIAAVARAVAEAAADDEEARATILEPAAVALAETVDAVRRRLDWPADDPPPLALAGGFLLGTPAIRDRVVALLDGRIGPIQAVAEPVRGALVLARKALP